MKRLIAIGALCASLATASFAQFTLVFNGGDVYWNGSDPYVDVPLIFQISGPSGAVWDAFAIRFTVPRPQATIIGGRAGQDPNFYDFSSGPGTFTALRITAAAVPPYAGQPAGQIYSVTSSAIDVAFALVGDDQSVYEDLDPSAEAYTKGVLATRYSNPNNAANRVPFTLRLYAPEIGIGNSVSFTLVDQVITEGSNRYQLNMSGATWTIVPEPASMIALGSGLVGLLALRRRRQA